METKPLDSGLWSGDWRLDVGRATLGECQMRLISFLSRLICEKKLQALTHENVQLKTLYFFLARWKNRGNIGHVCTVHTSFLQSSQDSSSQRVPFLQCLSKLLLSFLSETLIAFCYPLTYLCELWNERKNERLGCRPWLSRFRPDRGRDGVFPSVADNASSWFCVSSCSSHAIGRHLPRRRLATGT